MKEVSIRSMVVAPKDHILLSFDLSQAESWVVAYSANEMHMKEYLTKSDIHTETAAVLFDRSREDMFLLKKSGDLTFKRMRYTGKRYNHASAYRMKYLRAAQVINKDSDKPPYVVVTNPESKRFSEKWNSHYVLKPWWDEIETDLADRVITTTYGRTRTFFGQWGDELFKEATAHIPQSTVADHFKGAIHPELGIPGGLLEVRKQFVAKGIIRITNESHDSFLAECRVRDYSDVIQQIANLLHRPMVIKGETFKIPVDCEIGERWGELEKAKLVA